MKKFLSFLTVLFLLLSLIIILLIAIFDNNLFFKAADMIKNYIWPAGIILLIFLTFLSAGIVSNLHRSDGSLINNGFFQFAMLLLFLFSAGLGYFWYYVQQPGHIIIRIQPENTREFVNLGLRYNFLESAAMDTISAPGELRNRPAGIYSFETLDPDIVYFQANVILEPAETKTLVIPVTLNYKSLAVQTEPAGAEIWIDGLQTSQTPDTFEIFNRDTVILELKMKGYQVHVDTISLKENLDLGIILLEKLYTLRISCRYDYTEYKIYDMDRRMVYSARGSRRVQLIKGKYKLAYGIGEGQYETKTISLNYNTTVSIP